MPVDQAQLDNLAEHERLKRSTTLPLFHGRKDKNDLKARDYIERFEKAARIGKWTTDERKIDEFTNLLRDDAKEWYDALKDFPGIDLKKFNDIKVAFIRDYETKFTAKTICANFRDLHQKPQETVRDYWAKVSGIFRKMYEAAPDKMGDLSTHLDDATIAGLTNAEEERVSTAIKFGMNTSKMFIQTQMFIAGLREELRHRVMESGKTDPLEIFRFAQEMEQIEDEKRHKKPVSMVKAVAEVTEDQANYVNEDSAHLEGLDDEELEVVNAIRYQRGKAPYRRGQSFSRPNSSAGPKKQPIKCRYCQKLGHMQKECKSRLRDNAPEVDVNGKPYTSFSSKPASSPSGNTRVHAVQEIEGHISSYAQAAVHAVQEMRSDYLNAVDHLNWS